ncbi:MAG: hypothetical protein OEW45_02955 [Deltaproteobacteria bacterium]|nr:hypothetical protein [Deltaproteobacteria bacterium]
MPLARAGSRLSYSMVNMPEEPILDPKDQDQPLSPEEEGLLDKIVVKEEEAAQFSPDLIYDFQENLNEEQRQNLYQKILKMSVPEKIRLAMLGNREARNILILDRNKVIPMAVMRSPRLTDNDILTLAQHRNLPNEVYKYIALNKKWIKNYPVKLALVNNPKTPLPIAIRLLEHIHDNDLKAVRRNKNISSVLNRAAFQIQAKRGVS